MKTKLALLGILTLSSSALAAVSPKEAPVCFEAKTSIPSESGYTGTIVKDGLMFEFERLGFPLKNRVKTTIISNANQGVRYAFTSRIILPGYHTEGVAGYLSARGFNVMFPVLPFYLDTETGKQYFEGDLTFNGKDYSIFCNQAVAEFFN